MAMNPRLLRPAASLHPEAAVWRNRVIANGGTASVGTLFAVSRFCRRIDAEPGLRAAILRLNLFCGNSDNDLRAVRTPLYLSGSFGGSTIGNSIDINNNFLPQDYQETGSGGGLEGDGSTKFLSTGFLQNSFASVNSRHLSASATSLETTGNTMLLGSYVFPGGEGLSTLVTLDAATENSNRGFRSGTGTGSSSVFAHSGGTAESHMIGTRTASNLATTYRAGLLAVSNANPATLTTISREIPVFAAINGSTAANFTAARIRMYSIGNGLTAAQALAFSNAVIAFNTALGRA